MNHHPDLDLLTYPHLDVRLTSHDAGGVTARDVKLARTISEQAAGEGVRVRLTPGCGTAVPRSGTAGRLA